MTTLAIIWFLLICVLLSVFAVLDGFDMGVGFWHLKAKGDDQRRTLLNSIGPVWDGNEVWLLTGAGAIFAAFPPVYASVFSGFYLAMMLLITTLVGRAVALEFRSKEKSTIWRGFWDKVFSVCSILAAVLFGVALGNILGGITLNENGDYTGTFIGLLNPYAIGVGILNLMMFAFHGSNFIRLKTSGELETNAKSWGFLSGVVYLFLFIAVIVMSATMKPQLLRNFNICFILWLIPILAGLLIAASMFFGKKDHVGKAFIASSLSIVFLMATAAVALFPNMVPASNDAALSLTVYNSSSSELTLKTMLILTIIGLPFVIGYTIWVYKAFAGKVNILDNSNHY